MVGSGTSARRIANGASRRIGTPGTPEKSNDGRYLERRDKQGGSITQSTECHNGGIFYFFKWTSWSDEAPICSKEETPCVFHEDFIDGGYRRPRSAMDCVKGCLRWHNETMNIWTHVIGTVFALWRLLNLIEDVNEKKSAAHNSAEVEDIGRLYTPLILYGASIALVAITSSLAHSFHTLSPRCHHICFMFDYAAIGVCFICSASGYFFYSRPTNLSDVHFWFSFPLSYLAAATIVNCLVFLCLSYLRIHVKAAVRTVFIPFAATSSYFFCFSPYVTRYIYCHTESDRSCELFEETSMMYHSYQTTLTTVSAFLMATKVPECLAPGVFDILGHSHQMMHITTFVSAWFGWTAMEIDLSTRYHELFHSEIQPHDPHMYGLLAIYVVVALLGILVMSRNIDHHGKWKQQ